MLKIASHHNITIPPKSPNEELTRKSVKKRNIAMRNLPTVASSTNECDIGYIFFFGFMLCVVWNFEMTKSTFIFLQKKIFPNGEQ